MPGYKCRCEGTGFYGNRCQIRCPASYERVESYPVECIIIWEWEDNINATFTDLERISEEIIFTIIKKYIQYKSKNGRALFYHFYFVFLIFFL